MPVHIDAPHERESDGTVSPDGKVVRTRTETRWVRVTGGEPRALVELTVQAAGLVPGVGYPDDPVCTLRRFGLKEMGPANEHKRYRLKLDYSTETPEPKEEEESENPLLEPAEVSWGSTKGTRIVEREVTSGDPILNAAGLPYVNAPEVPYSRDLLTISRNEPFYDPARARGMKNRTNSSEFYRAAAGTLRCNDITGTRGNKHGITFWKVTYEFEYEPDGWDPDLLEADIYELDEDGARVKIKDAQNREVTTAVPIDEDGHAIPASALPAAAVYTNWQVYLRADFRSLGL